MEHLRAQAFAWSQRLGKGSQVGLMERWFDRYHSLGRIWSHRDAVVDGENILGLCSGSGRVPCKGTV